MRRCVGVEHVGHLRLCGSSLWFQRVSGVQESSSALRISHTFIGSLHRLQELFCELLHLLHGRLVRLAGAFSLIVVLYRAHSLPPLGWMVQPSERISVDWLEGGNVAKCVI